MCRFKDESDRREAACTEDAPFQGRVGPSKPHMKSELREPFPTVATTFDSSAVGSTTTGALKRRRVGVGNGKERAADALRTRRVVGEKVDLPSPGVLGQQPAL